MSGLNRDRNTVRKEGEYAAYPVKGGSVIFAGSIVCIGADGYAVPGSDSVGLRFVGMARGYVDNAAGGDGAQKAEVWRKGCFELSASEMVIADVGESMCVLDNQTVCKTATATNGVHCGRISEVNSGSSVYVDIAL